MSSPSAPRTSPAPRNPCQPSSHTYFSRLSRRFFKSSTSIDLPSPPPQHQSLRATKRLCSLKRKSNNYFATQARNISPSPDLEVPQTSHAESDLERLVETMHRGGMGNQASIPMLSDTAPVLKLRPRDTSMFNPSDETALGPHDTSIVHPADETGTTKTETTSNRLIDFVGAEVFLKDEPAILPPSAPTTKTTMKRPLPPPKSRHMVREEAKRAREIIDIGEDIKEAGPMTKRVKTGQEANMLRPVTQSVTGPIELPRTATGVQEVRHGRVEEQRVRQGLARTTGGGSGSSSAIDSDVQNGGATAKYAPTTPEKKREKKKKLFSASTAKGGSVPLQYLGKTSNGNTPNGNVFASEKASVDPHPLPDVASLQARNSDSESANGAVQPVTGAREKTFHNQANSMFIDEGYGSFTMLDADDNDHLPEDEAELMKRINGSLGLSSPFATNGRAKGPKVVTPEQAYAEKQRERDVERSRRMREANLAAKEWKPKQTAIGGGGLSIGLLEDVEPGIHEINSPLAQHKSANDAGARREHQNEYLGLANGDRPALRRKQGENRPVDARKTDPTDHRQGSPTDAALLDFAENHVKSHGRHGSMKATQRSSARANPFAKLVANAEVLGSRDGDGTQTGFIQLLEQQLSNGGPGAKQTVGASDAASRQSIITQLTPKRKKKQEVRAPQTTSTARAQEACDDGQLAAEERRLELRNAPVSGDTSSALKARPTPRQEGSLLDQLVKQGEKRDRDFIADEPSEPDPLRPSPKAHPAASGPYSEGGKKTRNNQHQRAGRKSEKRAGHNVAAAEAILREAGLAPSLIEGFSGIQKVQWAKKEIWEAKMKKQLEKFDAKKNTPGPATFSPQSSTVKQANNSNAARDTVAAPDEESECEESEEEEGWEYAIRWPRIEQPKKVADSVALTPAVAKAEMTPAGSESEGEEEEEDAVENSEGLDRSGAGSPMLETQIVPREQFPNRQKPDADLLRQMQRKRYDDWSDEDDEVHEYVVKAETWGMTNFPAEHVLILGRYLDNDKAEAMVRDFILSCKPHGVGRTLEIQSVWSDGNFSQTMIRDGEAGCRAFVEAEIVSARQYPGLKDKVGRQKTYAVLVERTISRSSADGAVEKDVRATTVDDMQVFTTKSLANWEAKKRLVEWNKEHLRGPNDWGWRQTLEESLCQHVEELNEDGLLLTWKDDMQQGVTTDTMSVWVKEITPRGPRN